eukprot:Awhi_evm1s4295
MLTSGSKISIENWISIFNPFKIRFGTQNPKSFRLKYLRTLENFVYSCIPDGRKAKFNRLIYETYDYVFENCWDFPAKLPVDENKIPQLAGNYRTEIKKGLKNKNK